MPTIKINWYIGSYLVFCMQGGLYSLVVFCGIRVGELAEGYRIAGIQTFVVPGVTFMIIVNNVYANNNHSA